MDDEHARSGQSCGSTNRAVGTEDGVRQSLNVERLEVEDEESRSKRLQSIFEKLNSSTSLSSGPAGNQLGMPNLRFDFGERKTWAVDPPIELINRVQAFLPRMEASNAVLTQHVEVDPQSVDMEHIEDDAGQYIEMNLGLGVFDLKQKRQPADQDTEMTDSSSSSSFSASDFDTGSDSDLDSEEILSSFIPSSFFSRYPRSGAQSLDFNSSVGEKRKAARTIRPLPKRNSSSATQPRPKIVLLSETPDSHMA